MGTFRTRPLGAIVTSAFLLTAACTKEHDAPHTPPAAPPPGGGAPASDTATPATTAGSGVASPTATDAPAASGSAAPASAAGSPPPDLNVVVITIDSLRADMPWAGYPREIAPALSAFEKASVSYTRAYSISCYTAMSLGGFLSGRFPSELERSGYFFGNYPDSVLLFPELLQKAGVKTLTAHAHFYFDQKAGFRQGFDVYKILPGLTADNTTDKNITAPQHLELAKEILGDKANTSKRFFAWFHFLDPHDQYMPHEGIDYGKKGRDRYDGEVTFTDQHVGKLIDFVHQQEWGKRTVIVVSSDHGEAFGEHKMYRHGFEIWEMLVHVPLMIQAPGAKPRRIDNLRSAVDLAPTILELLGTSADPAMQGKSLVPELYGQAPDERDVIVDLPRTSDNDRRRALLHKQYKLISSGDDFGYELYDVIADPGETKDLKKEQKGVFEEMKALYKARSAKIKDVCPKNTEKLKGKSKGKPC